MSAGASAHRTDAPRPVYFREVLCYAPPYSGTNGGQTSLPFPACSSSTILSLANLQASSNGNGAIGLAANAVPPYAALADVRSTTSARDKASATVLLPGWRGASGPNRANERYVLGPAEMSSRAIAHATAYKNHTGVWEVDYTTTSAGAVLWDRVASESFHLILGIDLDGVVVSAPIIEPTQGSFTSFDGRGEIAGNLTRAEAMRLAHALAPSG